MPAMPTISRFRLVLLLALLAGLVACSAPTSRSDVLRATLYNYSADVRWGGLNSALDYLDPELMEAQPVSQIEQSRNAQYRVTGYQVVGEGENAEGMVQRDVQIGVINLHDQRERIINHRELWRWDAGKRRWLLASRPPLAGADR